jgi:hypothetical protein
MCVWLQILTDRDKCLTTMYVLVTIAYHNGSLLVVYCTGASCRAQNSKGAEMSSSLGVLSDDALRSLADRAGHLSLTHQLHHASSPSGPELKWRSVRCLGFLE